MRAARQQQWHLDFTAINRIHVPVALASMLLVVVLFGRGLWQRRLDDLTLLAGTVTLALARQRGGVRRDLGAARSLRRAPGLDRDLRGADRGRTRLGQR